MRNIPFLFAVVLSFLGIGESFGNDFSIFDENDECQGTSSISTLTLGSETKQLITLNNQSFVATFTEEETSHRTKISLENGTFYYAPYIAGIVKSEIPNGVVIWESGQATNIPHITQLATQQFGSDPWHGNTFSSPCTVTFSWESILSTQFDNTLADAELTVGTRCVKSSVPDSYRALPLQWLNTPAQVASDRHAKKLTILINTPNKIFGFEADIGDGGTKNCSAQLFPCNASNQGSWGTGGSNALNNPQAAIGNLFKRGKKFF